MPLEVLPDTSVQYWLICYDSAGRERRNDPDGLISERIAMALRTEPITDVFLFCHGWRNDVRSARNSYRQWVQTMADHIASNQRMHALRPRFHPLLVGLHWPSQPFGDERLPLRDDTLPDWVKHYAGRIADGAEAQDALRIVLKAAVRDPEPSTLPNTVVDAYRTLDYMSGLGHEGIGAAPGADRDDFDPVAVYDFAGHMLGGAALRLWRGVLSGIGVLSFWKMKDRARAFGESGARDLLSQIINNTGSDVRVHLMGHSFGCIVLASMITGSSGHGWLPRPVQSLTLIQGALSLWSFSANLPFAIGRPGYFHRVISGQVVDGPILTTYSRHDLAVSFWYPMGARRGPVDFASGDLPRYGALGAFGAQGDGFTIHSGQLLPVNRPYQLASGHIYNLDGQHVIRKEGWPEGAHNDFMHPEVAHAVLSAALPIST
jgi:hypothetical protein